MSILKTMAKVAIKAGASAWNTWREQEAMYRELRKHVDFVEITPEQYEQMLAAHELQARLQEVENQQSSLVHMPMPNLAHTPGRPWDYPFVRKQVGCCQDPAMAVSWQHDNEGIRRCCVCWQVCEDFR